MRKREQPPEISVKYGDPMPELEEIGEFYRRVIDEIPNAINYLVSSVWRIPQPFSKTIVEGTGQQKVEDPSPATALAVLKKQLQQAINVDEIIKAIRTEIAKKSAENNFTVLLAEETILKVEVGNPSAFPQISSPQGNYQLEGFKIHLEITPGKTVKGENWLSTHLLPAIAKYVEEKERKPKGKPAKTQVSVALKKAAPLPAVLSLDVFLQVTGDYKLHLPLRYEFFNCNINAVLPTVSETLLKLIPQNWVYFAQASGIAKHLQVDQTLAAKTIEAASQVLNKNHPLGLLAKFKEDDFILAQEGVGHELLTLYKRHIQRQPTLIVTVKPERGELLEKYELALPKEFGDYLSYHVVVSLEAGEVWAYGVVKNAGGIVEPLGGDIGASAAQAVSKLIESNIEKLFPAAHRIFIAIYTERIYAALTNEEYQKTLINKLRRFVLVSKPNFGINVGQGVVEFLASFEIVLSRLGIGKENPMTVVTIKFQIDGATQEGNYTTITCRADISVSVGVSKDEDVVKKEDTEERSFPLNKYGTQEDNEKLGIFLVDAFSIAGGLIKEALIEHIEEVESTGLPQFRQALGKAIMLYTPTAQDEEDGDSHA